MLTSMAQISASDIGLVDASAQASIGALAYGDCYISTATANAAAYATAPGTNITRYSGNLYIYLKGVASTIAGSVVTYDLSDGTTALATTSTAVGLPLAVATSANVAATTYGWYLVQGIGVMATNNDVADNSRMQTTAAGGNVDDTTTANKYINGLIARAATTSGAAATTIGQATFPIANLAV